MIPHVVYFQVFVHEALGRNTDERVKTMAGAEETYDRFVVNKTFSENIPLLQTKCTVNLCVT